MLGSNRSKRPRAIAAVDFEHWYIAMERKYASKPDIKAWSDEIRDKYDVEEIAFFGDFSNGGLRGELDKIRNVSGMVINTQNSSENYEKDFTDFIMLDYIYQKAMTGKHVDTFIIFTGDGHFSSVVRFIINVCRKKVGIYGVKNAVSYQLKESASWYKELPENEAAASAYYKMIANHMSYLMVHREFGENSTAQKIAENTAKKNNVRQKQVAIALERMIKNGYLVQTKTGGKNEKKINVIKANWQKLEQDGIWEQP
jgi:uncharacterized LabA/DUF88 family protein